MRLSKIIQHQPTSIHIRGQLNSAISLARTTPDFTTQAFEHPEAYEAGLNEPYYPIPREETQAIFKKYEQSALSLKNVVFAGRLADYSYYNMDQVVGRALSCFEKQIAVC